jgi:hypothetical protein
MMCGVTAYVYHICWNPSFLDSWKIHLNFLLFQGYQFNLFRRFFVLSWKEQQ